MSKSTSNGVIAYAGLRIRIKGNRLVEAESTGMSVSEFRTINKKIRDFIIADAGTAIASVLMNTSRPVEGFYRAPDDAFEIAPAPPEAPRPRALLNDHPFVFQFPVRRSLDQHITGARFRLQQAVWLWFLNAVPPDYFQPAIARPNRQRWGWPVAADPPVLESSWMDDGYFFLSWSPPEQFLELESPLARPERPRIPTERQSRRSPRASCLLRRRRPTFPILGARGTRPVPARRAVAIGSNGHRLAPRLAFHRPRCGLCRGARTLSTGHSTMPYL